MENKSFSIKGLTFAYDKKVISNNLNFDIEKGKITTILGPNGCGKSTLFQLLTKNLEPSKGDIRFEGISLSNISLKDFSKKVAIVHQNNTAPGDITVKQLVSYGRIPFMKPGFNSLTEKDEQYIERALKITGTTAFADRTIESLSGGQRQRVWIAMALAQGTKTLLLDEPTTYLDIRYQLQILKLVKVLNEKLGMTIIMVLHDINQAACFSDEIVALTSKGTLLAKGSPDEVITSELLKNLYGINLDVVNYEGKKVVMI